MSLVVIGASGYIGASLLTRAPADSWGTSSTGKGGTVRFDLADPSDFPWQRISADDVILLTAAISSPDICAREHDRAWAVNVTGTSEFVSKVMDRGVRVIFFSSDTVYGERNDEFDEHAVCKPAGEYASMKHEVEKRFLGNVLFKAVRLSYVFSREDKFTKYLSGCSERNEVAEIFHPFYRSVVHRQDVVESAIALANRWDEFPLPVINFGGPEVLSRTEFAKTLNDTVLSNLRFRVIEPEAVFFMNRPRVIRMASPHLSSLLGRPAHTLHDAAYIEFNLKEGNEHV